MSSFHPFEVVGRGSETQMKVGKNLNVHGSDLKVKFVLNNTTGL